jgi:hypothetical protein
VSAYIGEKCILGELHQSILLNFSGTAQPMAPFLDIFINQLSTNVNETTRTLKLISTHPPYEDTTTANEQLLRLCMITHYAQALVAKALVELIFTVVNSYRTLLFLLPLYRELKQVNCRNAHFSTEVCQ